MDFVRQGVAVRARTGADHVGGAAQAGGKDFFQRCVAAALRSPMGIGGSKYRRSGEEGFVESVWPGAFRRSVFERVGLFDENATTNEDAELNQRLLAAGARIYMSGDIVAHYYPRESMRALARQYFKYGQGRARTLLKHGRLLSIRPAVPFLWLVSGTVLLAPAPSHLLGFLTAPLSLPTGPTALPP